MSQLEEEIKVLIVESLFLEEVNPQDIDSEEALFGDDGLALDSIDALEIGVEIQKRYDVKIDTEDENLREHFMNVRNLARFVETNRKVLGQVNG